MDSAINPLFGATMRELRGSCPSLRQLEGPTLTNRTDLSLIERGLKQVSPDTAKRLDEALGANGRLIALARPADGVDEDRMRYVRKHPRHVDPTTVKSLGVILAHQRLMEDDIGSASMLGAATQQLTIVEGLITASVGDVRKGLVDVGAQWAQFVGWLNTAVGRAAESTARFDQALVWAAETGDREMTATALSFKGHLAERLGQVGPMLGLTEAAMRDPGVYVGQRAYDALQLARARAMLEDRIQVVDTLAKAKDLIAQSAEYDGPAPPWNYYYRSQSFFSLEEGWVYLLLGEHDEDAARHAVDLLTDGLDRLPPDQRGSEWATRYRVHLARAKLLDGDTVGAREQLELVRLAANVHGATELQSQADALACQLTPP